MSRKKILSPKTIIAPSSFPYFVLCGCHKRMTSKSYILRKFLWKSLKHKAQLNKILEVSIQSPYSKQTNFFPKSFKRQLFYCQKWIPNYNKELLCSYDNNSQWGWYKGESYATKSGKTDLTQCSEGMKKNFWISGILHNTTTLSTYEVFS